MFFAEKLREAQRRFNDMKNEVMRTRRYIQENQVQPAQNFSIAFQHLLTANARKQGRKRLEDLRLAFHEFYYGLVLLQKFQELNQSGFRKILKKHDKLLKVTSGNAWYREKVSSIQYIRTLKAFKNHLVKLLFSIFCIN